MSDELQTAVLDALGDPTRRAIVDQLRGGPVAVGRIAERLPVSRPAVSRHLRVLSEAGLVRVQPMGTRRLYALDPAGLEAIRAYFDEMWLRALDALKAAAEEGAPPSPTASSPTASSPTSSQPAPRRERGTPRRRR